MIPEPLNVLLVEDRIDDAELMVIALHEAGFDPTWHRVDTKEAYLHHLAQEPDIILADYQLPQFTGLQALQLLQSTGLDIPFIIVTGFYEENGLTCMKLGAADYLLKDRLGRLGEAVRQALAGRALRREKQEAEEAEREERRFAEALADTAVALNGSLDLDEVLDRVLENVKKVIPHDAVNIMLLEGEIIRTVRRQGYEERQGPEPPSLPSYQLKDVYYYDWMVKTGQLAVIPDTHHDPHWLHLPGREWIQSYIGIPIQLHHECIGFLNLISTTPGFFNEKHGQRLVAFTAQVATALQNARLYAALASYSETLENTVIARTEALNSALNQLQTILNNSPDPILLVQPDGKIETGNPAFKETFGYEFTEVSQQGLLSLISPKWAKPFMDTMFDVLSKHERQRLELKAQTQNGRELDIDLALAPVNVEGQNLPMIVCSLRDITALKEVQRMKEPFVSNVSHELRTPISVLMLYHGTLSLKPEKFHHLKDKISREIKRLDLIIEDLLRLSRLDQGQVQLEEKLVNLNQIAAEGVADRQVLAEQKELNLTFEPGEEAALACGDPGLLGQVLSILLTNALNYTPVHGNIQVRTVTWSIANRPLVGFSVQDDGPGIPLEEQKKLFDRFYRGKTGHESKMPGTGLGLAIAQEIASRHQGEISVHSVPGEGSTFTVWLPAASSTDPLPFG